MIRYADNTFELPGSWTYRAKAAPDRKYVPATRTWQLPNNRANRKFLLGNFLPTDFQPNALTAANAADVVKVVEVPRPVWPKEVKNHVTGEIFAVLDHQREALDKAWDVRSFAFFHEMGSGKTLTMLLFWDALFKAGLINEAWAICPNSLIDNWKDEIRKWTPWNFDNIKVYGILSLSAGRLPIELAGRSHGGLAVAVDESQRIKNSQAKRTKVMHEIGKNAAYKSVLTGTSITKGVEDLYSQYGFLDPEILGYKSFYSFRNHFCVMGGFENKQIVAYQNLGELMKAVLPYTHVVKDPVKLPPQTLEIRTVDLAPEQKRLLAELKSLMQTEMAGTKLTVTNTLAYYTRGAQILGGFFPLADGQVVRLPTNNKLDELIEIAEGTDKKIVVFARFVPEVNMIMAALRDKGINCRQIKAKDPDLQRQVQDFREDPDVQVIVSTYAMGSVGFTLIEGKILVEYSGTFNYEESVQARRRIYRIGQESETKVIRLMAKSKLDYAMKDIADRKQTLADFVTNSLADPRALLNLLD